MEAFILLFLKKFSIKIPPIFLFSDKMSLGHFIDNSGILIFSKAFIIAKQTSAFNLKGLNKRPSNCL